jgi:hypothetical protein
MRTGDRDEHLRAVAAEQLADPARRELLRLALDEELPARHHRASDACQPPEQHRQHDRREQRQADGGQQGPCIARLFEFTQRQLETLRGRAGGVHRRFRRVWIQVGHQDRKASRPLIMTAAPFGNLPRS